MIFHSFAVHNVKINVFGYMPSRFFLHFSIMTIKVADQYLTFFNNIFAWSLSIIEYFNNLCFVIDVHALCNLKRFSEMETPEHFSLVEAKYMGKNISLVYLV